MQHATFTTARSRLMPLAALLLAAALGGCVGYSSYPSRDYSYSYPGSYTPAIRKITAVLMATALTILPTTAVQR
jgi:hypothetical protein